MDLTTRLTDAQFNALSNVIQVVDQPRESFRGI